MVQLERKAKGASTSLAVLLGKFTQKYKSSNVFWTWPVSKKKERDLKV